MARKTDTPEEIQTEDLLAEIARLKAKLAEKDPAAPTKSAYNGDELVEYTAPIIGAGDQDMKPLFVGVNGETIAIRPGVPVKIKRKFLDALEHANDQRISAWNYMRQQQEAGRKALSEM